MTINHSIAVFGEALVDLFKNATVVGGAPFNVARHLAGFQLSPLLISAIGKDNAGELILQELKKFNLSTAGVQILPHQRSGAVEVHERAHGHEFEIMPDSAYDLIDTDTAIKSIESININESNTANKQLLYHGSLGLRAQQSRATFLNLRKHLNAQSNLTVFLDLNWREGHVTPEIAKQILTQSDVIKVSIEELWMLMPWFGILILTDNKLPEEGFHDYPIQNLMSQLNAKLLLVTYGPLGSAVYDHLGVCLNTAQAVKGIKLVDTVGAGDAFSSVMIFGLLNKWPLDVALKRANAFAGSICSIRGAVPQDMQFYKKFMRSWKNEAHLLNTKN